MRFQGAEVGKTFSHALSDLGRIGGGAKGGLEVGPQGLVGDGGGERDAEDRAEGAEEVGAGGCYGLVVAGGVGD